MNAMIAYVRNTRGNDITKLRLCTKKELPSISESATKTARANVRDLTESNINPSIPTDVAGRSKSALNLNTLTAVDVMENDAHKIATKLAMRARLSNPGKERNVTDALNTIAALPQKQETRL